jgi:RES domain-containing protein
VLDLADATVRSQGGLTAHERASDTLAVLARLAAGAEWAASTGFEALLAPSAARAHALALTVFPAGVARLTVVTQSVEHAPEL